jgi:hypothetical protein
VNVSPKEWCAKPDRQIGIGHEQAFTDRLSEIQWLDFVHGRFLRTF